MGLFNRVMVGCPECGKDIEFQTKSGSCLLKVFHITRVPEYEVRGILGDIEHCPECGEEVIIGGKEPEYEDFSYLIKKGVEYE